ncbi:MAG: DUF3990 domain-containing protein [Lachnospiraceae bacterium]|nr:DUF3990 domain-containing protein [Lachnospiraceae bacterium]
MVLYHGSLMVVEHPEYGLGRVNNDYGQGFYCTEDIELAKEWASRDINGGFVNKYEFDDSGLRVLDISDLGLLAWITILIRNRSIRYASPIEKRSAEFLLSRYLPVYEEYDVIRGYRADDSYFSYTRAFLSNTITLEQLEMAVRLGNLGMQICLKSPESFGRIRFTDAETVDGYHYYPMRMKRDRKARNDHMRLLEEDAVDGTYIRDIIREGGA